MAAVKELDLLFEMFRLADQVSRDRAWELREARQSSQGGERFKNSLFEGENCLKHTLAFEL